MDFKTILRSQWDRSGAIVASVAGLIVLLIGWVGISGTPYLAEQLPYIISGGIVGLFFLGLGATLWISADLRDEWAKLDRIESALLDGSLRWTEEPAAAPTHYVGNGPDHFQPVEPEPVPAWTPDYFDQTSEQPVVAEAAAKPARRTRARAAAPSDTKPTTRKRPTSSTRRSSLARGQASVAGAGQDSAL